MSASIVCFGEALWDVLPRGLFPGGAPLNVAYHLRQLGAAPLPVTAVGRDFLGEEIVRRLRGWGLPVSGVARTGRPTGTVRAELGPDGSALYRIARGVAWDRIGLSPAALRAARTARAIVHGTLALREAPNRRALAALAVAAPQALRVCDVNLRPPFARRFVEEAMAGAGLLKLNDAELALLAGTRPTAAPARLRAAARRLAERTGCPRVCVTAGARGAGLLWEGEWRWEPGRKVAVRDTVGAGDAFLAALLDGTLLSKRKPGDALARACRLGEYVASRDGATPPHDGF